jgi:energy-coupling factor transporter ATP-binding protein EcfA2
VAAEDAALLVVEHKTDLLDGLCSRVLVIDDGRIEVVDLKSGRRKIVHSGGIYARYVASGHLLYVHRNTLLAAPFDLGRLEITAKPVPVLREVMTNGAGGYHYDVSADGTLVENEIYNTIHKVPGTPP